MPLNFTSDIMALFATKVGNDANYESPGNFGLSGGGSGSIGVDHVTVTNAGVYTAVPTATASSGAATFSVTMKLLAGTTLAAAGTGYAPNDILSTVGGTHTTFAQVTVATVKLVSATITSGHAGTGYGNAQTFNVTVAGGTETVAATVNVTTSAGGVVTTINSVVGGSYTVLPTLLGNAVTGDDGTDHGTGLQLDLVFGINTFTVNVPGVYTALPANPITTAETGAGTGTGATLTGSWGVNTVLVTTPGSYETGAPTIAFSPASTTAATAVLTTGGSGADEQKILMLVEIVRSFVAEATTPGQLKDAHEVLRKMLAAMRSGAPLTFTSATNATEVLNAAMHYVAGNPKRINLQI